MNKVMMAIGFLFVNFSSFAMDSWARRQEHERQVANYNAEV